LGYINNANAPMHSVTASLSEMVSYLDITGLDHQQNSDVRYDWQSPAQTVHGHDLILVLHLCDATVLLLYAA